MKIKNVSAVLVLATIFVSCKSSAIVVAPTMAYTPTFSSISPTITPTSIYFSPKDPYPPCNTYFEQRQPTVTEPTQTPLKQVELIDGLTLTEYNYWDISIPIENSGCIYAIRDRAHLPKEILIDNLFQIIVSKSENGKERVAVLKENETIFEKEINSYFYSGLIEAWGYDNHWVIEYVTTGFTSQDGRVIQPSGDITDIIVDGVSVKEKNNYKSVFAFQILDERPLYFFKTQDNIYGINFDGSEIQLDYDEIPYDNLHFGYDSTIFDYQNMVLFRAQKGDTWYTVVIGAFNP